MKQLRYLTLAVVFLGSTCFAAQAEAIADSGIQPAIAKMSGRKFVAVDGSALTIVAFDGGFAREIDTADGGVRIETFTLAGPQTGVVADGGADHQAGTFRITDSGIDADFGDGRSETLAANAAGGLSLITGGAEGGRICTAWYPEGHQFSDSDRAAAMVETASETVAAGAGCGTGPAAHEARLGPHRSNHRIAANAGAVDVAMNTPRLRGLSPSVPVLLGK